MISTQYQAQVLEGQADLVLIGADSVLADGVLANKAGAYLLARAAREKGITRKWDERERPGHPCRRPGLGG